jgi:hypothetical protein
MGVNSAGANVLPHRIGSGIPFRRQASGFDHELFCPRLFSEKVPQESVSEEVP